MWYLQERPRLFEKVMKMRLLTLPSKRTVNKAISLDFTQE